MHKMAYNLLLVFKCFKTNVNLALAGTA